MNKKINQESNTFRTYFQFGWKSAMLVIVALFGIQSAYAAITTQLDMGDRGAEVTELQTYLATDVVIYPERLVTGYFGQLTKAAVERFQTAEGIVSQGTPATTGYGRVGPRTQSAINAKLAGGGGTGNVSGDVYAPIVKSTHVNMANNSAIITWTANEAAMGKVYYSTSPITISNVFDVTGVFSGEPVVSGTLAEYDAAARVTHTVNITNLTPNTTYYYLVVVFDASKNSSITAPASFRTLQ